KNLRRMLESFHTIEAFFKGLAPTNGSMARKNQRAMGGQELAQCRAHRLGGGALIRHDGQPATAENHFAETIGGNLTKLWMSQRPCNGMRRMGVYDRASFGTLTINLEMHRALAGRF